MRKALRNEIEFCRVSSTGRKKEKQVQDNTRGEIERPSKQAALSFSPSLSWRHFFTFCIQLLLLSSSVFLYTTPHGSPPAISLPLSPLSFSLPKPPPLSLVSLSQSLKPPHKLLTQAWRDSIRCCAIAEIRDGVSLGGEDQGVLVDPSSQEEVRGERHVAKYDWKEEWYPLYLTKDIPEDAPMGLTVLISSLCCIVMARPASVLRRSMPP
ncbi:Protein TIC 55, chloroplastic [Vitis vinifera]|uniref:Protein TIC 55, chloroplastic n=1 Tax=Vitis vinifera TaxID=29760 RepID=A0A438KF63_VITVI|nr:Protein TIC 55, chloroplastic [Vitis vinifera]